jgi:hypothetical protein
MDNYSGKDYRNIGIIAAVAIAIAAMMIPGANLANIAYASHGSSTKDSGNSVQSTDQSNSNSASNSGSGGSSHADHNTQINSADNSASVHIHNGHHKNHKDSGKYTGSKDDHHGKSGHSTKDSGNVLQIVKQSNDNSASNSGSGGSANANNNFQLNDASNTADVHISSGHHNDNGGQQTWYGDHKKGGSISDSGKVVQAIQQSNTNTATNTGAGGSANANNNVQINLADNKANVDIHNHGSGSVDNSGNVAQLITQSNTNTATNNPPPPPSGGPIFACLIGPTIPPCGASASGNTQINSADNHADVSIGNH